MFRPITKTVERKKSVWFDKSQKEEDLRAIIIKFTSLYPELIFLRDKVDLSFDKSQTILYLKTQNKTQANELMLHLGALARLIRQQGIDLKKIVVI